MSQVIECPSGLRGVIRGLKVKELNILADRRLAKSGRQFDQILAGCWLETIEHGPYAPGDQSLDWGKVLQGDRFYAMVKIRAASLGADYAFAVVCQNAACGHRFEWEVCLDELPVKRLSEESRRRFQEGNRFETQLPGTGTHVWFRLAVGADESRMANHRQAHQDALWSTMLALRVVEIEGVLESQKRRFLEELDVSDAEHLRAAFDEVDCGVETTIEVECPECLGVQSVELPFGPASSWRRSRRRGRRRPLPTRSRGGYSRGDLSALLDAARRQWPWLDAQRGARARPGRALLVARAHFRPARPGSPCHREGQPRMTDRGRHAC